MDSHVRTAMLAQPPPKPSKCTPVRAGAVAAAVYLLLCLCAVLTFFYVADIIMTQMPRVLRAADRLNAALDALYQVACNQTVPLLPTNKCVALK